MLKKWIIGILLVTVLGAAGAAIATQANNNSDTSDSAPSVLASTTGSTSVQAQVGQSDPQSQNDMGQPWSASGEIVGLDDYGFDLTIENGEKVYVELGPPDFWPNQGVELQSGMTITVEGTENEGMYHAYTLTLSEGQVLQLRTEQGQPLWSGGVTNGRGQNGNQASGDGDRIPDPQAQVDEWVTITGELIAFQGGSMTINTSEGELLPFQTGQPRFFASQGVTFNVGDEIILVGFYDGDQFVAGDITQVATGMRVMLRDPNGRPLWAGPGNGNGNGNGGQGGQAGSQS